VKITKLLIIQNFPSSLSLAVCYVRTYSASLCPSLTVLLKLISQTCLKRNPLTMETCLSRKTFTVQKIHTSSFVSLPSPLLPVHSRCRGCLLSLDHTQTHTTVGRTPLDEGSARRRDLYLTTQTFTRNKHPCPEPTVPASARPQTYALDRAATGTGTSPTPSHILWYQLIRHC
jgi:hypothetical protein